MKENLEKKIESILFWKAEPIKVSELAQILQLKDREINEALKTLQERLSDRGLSLIINDNKVALVTCPEASDIIEKLHKEELTKDLSKATLETLTIVLYRGPMRRSEIDYIRGVNSQFTLRALLVRGLIEKKIDEKDERAYIYSTTIDTLAHLGVSNVEELPDYESVNTDIDTFLESEVGGKEYE